MRDYGAPANAWRHPKARCENDGERSPCSQSRAFSSDYDSVPALVLNPSEVVLPRKLTARLRYHRQSRIPAAQPAAKARTSTQVGTIIRAAPNMASLYDSHRV
jgi:hypothetical protein